VIFLPSLLLLPLSDSTFDEVVVDDSLESNAVDEEIIFAR
jgi:hypothetical protein